MGYSSYHHILNDKALLKKIHHQINSARVFSTDKTFLICIYYLFNYRILVINRNYINRIGRKNNFFIIMSLVFIFRRQSVVHLSMKQCQINSTKFKSTNSKKEDTKINIKMKTPIGNVKFKWLSCR